MLAGIDVGSTGIKLALYSLEGVRLDQAYRSYAPDYQDGGRVTIDPEIWWRSLCACAAELAARQDLRRIRAIGISHANALIPADEALQAPFGAIMQSDKRGESMVAAIGRDLGEERIFSVTGNRNAAGFLWGPTLKWLYERERETFETIRYLFTPTSYLVMRLTGAYSMDHTRAATTMLYDIGTGQWDEALCGYFHVSPRMRPPLRGARDIVGHTRETAEIAIPGGIPVTAGCMDTVAAMQGLTGGREENTLILGSVGRFGVYADRLDRRFLNTQLPDRSRKISMSPVNNAGISVNWIRDLLLPGKTGAESFRELDRLADTAPAGSRGLRYFPYLTGSACPHWNGDARGAFLGMEAFHGPACFARAVLEGVGFALWENLRLLESACGVGPGRIHVGGGGARSRVWRQILSDILDRELAVPRHLETETMGCAILAGIAVGLLSPGDAAAWNGVTETVVPRPENAAVYRGAAEEFRALHPLLEQAGAITGKQRRDV